MPKSIFCMVVNMAYLWKILIRFENIFNQNVYFSQGTWQIHTYNIHNMTKYVPREEETREARLIGLVLKKSLKKKKK